MSFTEDEVSIHVATDIPDKKLLTHHVPSRPGLSNCRNHCPQLRFDSRIWSRQDSSRSGRSHRSVGPAEAPESACNKVSADLHLGFFPERRACLHSCDQSSSGARRSRLCKVSMAVDLTRSLPDQLLIKSQQAVQRRKRSAS